VAQFGVAWEDHLTVPGGAANSGDPWWPLLDETPFDDAVTQYGPIAGGTGFSVKAFRTRLNGPLYDPGVHTGHVVRVRANCTLQVGTNWKIRVQLLQGGTQIAEIPSSTAMTQGWTTYTLSLSTAEAGNITDYSDLRVRVTVSQFSSGDGGQAFVSAIEIELPDAAATDGTFADEAEADEDFDAQEVAGVAFEDFAEAFEHFGASAAAGRLVAQGRRFVVVRTTIDLTARAVPIVGRGR
jgi:hypothetical protein